jgi:SlyX protein
MTDDAQSGEAQSGEAQSDEAQTDEAQTDDARITDLQTRLAHHEQTLDDLSDVVAGQARVIDRLVRRLNETEGALGDVAEALDRAGTPVHQKPPHY